MKHSTSKFLKQTALDLRLGLATSVISVAAFAAEAQEKGAPSPIGGNSSGAGSPITDFTMGAMVYVLLAGALVVILLGGGMLVLNLGLLSKREEDKTGVRNPSDVGVLKNQVWPPEADHSPRLPAQAEAEDAAIDKKASELAERAKNRLRGSRPAA
jgi:hypothetical protein